MNGEEFWRLGDELELDFFVSKGVRKGGCLLVAMFRIKFKAKFNPHSEGVLKMF